MLDKAPYTDDNLKIQGSNDGGASFSDLYSYTDEIHEGWNAINWREAPKVYSTIRFQGAVAGSCRIGEIRLLGVEVLDNASSSASCTAKLNFDGVVTDLSDVMYTDAATPSLTAVSGVMPRYGSVLGGEQVTFTG